MFPCHKHTSLVWDIFCQLRSSPAYITEQMQKCVGVPAGDKKGSFKSQDSVDVVVFSCWASLIAVSSDDHRKKKKVSWSHGIYDGTLHEATIKSLLRIVVVKKPLK